MKKLTKLEVLNNEVKELFGENFKIYKTLTNCDIVEIINDRGGIRTILNFSKQKELENFISNLKTLKYKGLIK